MLAMSPWFATSAVIGELRVRWSIGTFESSLLVITVQVGFVLGAVASAVSGLADRVRPRRLVLVGALGATIAVVSDPRRFNRLTAFRDIEGNKEHLAWQSWQGLLSIASAVAERDLYAQGRTLERLGIAALSKDAMRALLDVGVTGVTGVSA